MIPSSTSAFYQRVHRDLSGLSARAQQLQTAIGTGERLTRGSDDPVAAARLRTLARAERLAGVDTALAERVRGDLEQTDSTLSAFAGQITRIRELAVQAANGVLNPGQRASIAAELDQLRGELVTLANTRDSLGQALFGGLGAGPAYVLDGAGNPVYAGTPSAGQIDLGDGQTLTRGITGPEFLDFAGTDLFAVTRTLADALRGAAPDPAQAARDALGALDQGLDALTTAQTVTGTRLAWLDLAADQRTARAELRAEEQAATGGTDLTTAVMQLQQTMTVLEASQASFARFSQLSLFNLLN